MLSIRIKTKNWQVHPRTWVPCLLLFMCLAACLPVAAAQATRTIRYDGNQSVTVPNTITRIACGWPAQNSIIAMLGYGNRIVATTDILKGIPLFRKFVPSIAHADYCFSGTDVQMEALLKSRPEVLFIPGSSLRKYEVLKQMGITVIPFRDNSLSAIVERTVITGEVLGPDAHKRGLAFQRYYNGNVARVQRVLAKIPRNKRLRVYHPMRDALSTAGRQSLVQDWMDLSGAINVAERWFPRMNTVTLEQVLKSDPDVIVAMTSDVARGILADPRWSFLKAVKNHRVYTNPRGMFWWCRETSEEALQILWMAKTLYPQAFRSLDMVKETRYFYKTFYGYSLNDQEVQEILYPR